MAVKDTDMIEVQNLTNHPIVYISHTGIRRYFAGKQIMKISVEELRQLGYSRGGVVLLRDYLSVKNKELAQEFGVDMEAFDNEYNWNIDDVDRVLTKGSMDELLDALDFAPVGVIDSIVDRAVALKIDDISKRRAIAEKTKRDINSMINSVEQAEAASAANGEPAQEQRRRRVTKTAQGSTTGRRTSKAAKEEAPAEQDATA